MKKTSQPLLVAVAVFGLGSLSALAQTSSTVSPYAGNGAGGFGGQIGPSLLSISDSNGVITFSLATRNTDGSAKPDGLGNDVAIYIDSAAGGITDTSTLTDTGDQGRRAISGNSTATARSLVNFATGFGADYAIHLNGSGDANLFNLTSPAGQPGILGTVTGANYSHVAGTNLYGFSINESDIGLTTGFTASFNFVATLLNANDGGNGGVYRSNETIGDSNVNNSSPNLAQGTLTYTDFDTFTVPEPATYVAGALAALLGGFQFVRRRSRA